MNLVAIFDFIALAGFIMAIVIALSTIGSRMHVNRLSAALVLLSMLIMVVVSLSNFLESSGIFGGLDRFEDHAEILFFPLMGYALYVMYSSNQMARLRSTMRTAKAEHDLLVGILDTTRVGIVLVDDVGCVTFSNRFASDVLNISECGGIQACTSEVQVVPAGSAVSERGVFHDSVQGRVIDGEQWEVVGPEGRTLIGLTASPLDESSGKQSGSVIVVTPIPAMSSPPGA